MIIPDNSCCLLLLILTYTCKLPDTHPDIVSRHHLPVINITDFKIYIYTKPDGPALMRLDAFNTWKKLKR